MVWYANDEHVIRRNNAHEIIILSRRDLFMGWASSGGGGPADKDDHVCRSRGVVGAAARY